VATLNPQYISNYLTSKSHGYHDARSSPLEDQTITWPCSVPVKNWKWDLSQWVVINLILPSASWVPSVDQSAQDTLSESGTSRIFNKIKTKLVSQKHLKTLSLAWKILVLGSKQEKIFLEYDLISVQNVMEIVLAEVGNHKPFYYVKSYLPVYWLAFFLNAIRMLFYLTMQTRKYQAINFLLFSH